MSTEASFIEDFFDNYFSPFISYKYHGYSERSDCIAKCKNPLGGLLPVSRLEQLEDLFRNESHWKNLCYFKHPDNKSYNESCSFFVDAEFNWQARMWQSNGLEIDEHIWQTDLQTFPRMPVMS